MGAIDTIKAKLFGGVAAGLAPLLDKLNHLAGEDAALGTERDDLLTRRGIRADTAGVPNLIAARHRELMATYGADLFDALTRAIRWSPDGVGRATGHLPDLLGGLSAFDLAVLLDPDGTAAKFVACVPEGAPGALTIPARLARIAAIDRERERIAAEHAALVDQAGALTPPITVPHLPVNVSRRADERIKREQEAVRRANA